MDMIATVFISAAGNRVRLLTISGVEHANTKEKHAKIIAKII
jgi:hypothetical protein